MTNVRSVRPRFIDDIVNRVNKKKARKIEPEVTNAQLLGSLQAINLSLDTLRTDHDALSTHVEELADEFRHEVHDLQDSSGRDIDDELQNSYTFTDLDRSVDELTSKVEDFEGIIDPDEFRELQGQVSTIVQVVKGIGSHIESETTYL